MKVLKVDDEGQVKVGHKGLTAWVDVWEGSNGELNADWNKYVFHLDNPSDVAIKKFQEDTDNFDAACSLAITEFITWKNDKN